MRQSQKCIFGSHNEVLNRFSSQTLDKLLSIRKRNQNSPASIRAQCLFNHTDSVNNKCLTRAPAGKLSSNKERINCPTTCLYKAWKYN